MNKYWQCRNRSAYSTLAIVQIFNKDSLDDSIGKPKALAPKSSKFSLSKNNEISVKKAQNEKKEQQLLD